MMQVGCPVWRDEWIEHGVPPQEAVLHAKSCAACRRALADQASTWALLAESKATTDAPSERFRAAVWENIDAAERSGILRRLRIAGPLVAAAAAIALVLVFGGDGNVDAPSAPPEELLANLDLYENLEFIEESGEELDWIAALESELSTSHAATDGDSDEE